MKEEIVEILVEERSMKNALEVLLPRILPEGYVLYGNCFVRHHQGKSDLQKSIPKKVKAFPYFPNPVKLIVIQDQDSNDCKVLKQNLAQLIKKENPNQAFLIRIACRELENWYLGQMSAIEEVYSSFKASRHENKAKFRNPDNVFGAVELQKLIKTFAKGFASREIPRYMNCEKNNSPSFKHLVSGIQKFLSN